MRGETVPGIVRAFPADWLTDVVVLRGGGRDAKGNPLPSEEIPVTDCLIGPRNTSEEDGSMVVSSEMALYRDPDPNFRFHSNDRIRVPDDARMAGMWAVDGRPMEYPLGVHVPIRSD